MNANNELIVECMCEILEMEDKSDELLEVLMSYGFTDEDDNLTQLGESIFNRRAEADDE
jgi:tRNA(His) 5'-end guanylyltransferase